MGQRIGAGVWRENAACRGSFGSLFYPPQKGEKRSDRRSREERAKWICGRCQVKTDCLSEALASNEATGIWGGLNEVERRALSLDGTSSNFGLEESSVVN